MAAVCTPNQAYCDANGDLSVCSSDGTKWEVSVCGAGKKCAGGACIDESDPTPPDPLPSDPEDPDNPEIPTDPEEPTDPVTPVDPEKPSDPVTPPDPAKPGNDEGNTEDPDNGKNNGSQNGEENGDGGKTGTPGQDGEKHDDETDLDLDKRGAVMVDDNCSQSQGEGHPVPWILARVLSCAAILRRKVKWSRE